MGLPTAATLPPTSGLCRLRVTGSLPSARRKPAREDYARCADDLGTGVVHAAPGSRIQLRARPLSDAKVAAAWQGASVPSGSAWTGSSFSASHRSAITSGCSTISISCWTPTRSQVGRAPVIHFGWECPSLRGVAHFRLTRRGEHSENVGLDELITNSAETFVETALRLAEGLAPARSTAGRIAQQNAADPLCATRNVLRETLKRHTCTSVRVLVTVFHERTGSQRDVAVGRCVSVGRAARAGGVAVSDNSQQPAECARRAAPAGTGSVAGGTQSRGSRRAATRGVDQADFPVLQYDLGEAAWRCNEFEQARAAFGKALELDPSMNNAPTQGAGRSVAATESNRRSPAASRSRSSTRSLTPAGCGPRWRRFTMSRDGLATLSRYCNARFQSHRGSLLFTTIWPSPSSRKAGSPRRWTNTARRCESGRRGNGGTATCCTV